VLIEYQNDFVSPGGKLHDAVKGVMQSGQIMVNTLKVVEEARKKVSGSCLLEGRALACTPSSSGRINLNLSFSSRWTRSPRTLARRER
jgi:hypothetical protein